MSEPCPGLSILLFGHSKSGKSTLASTAPGPRLFLDAEGGSGTRFLKTKKIEWENTMQPPPEDDGSWDTCVVHIRDFGTLSQVFQWLGAGKHPFRSVIIDSISETQQRCVDHIAGVDAMKIQDWGELGRKVSSLIRQFRDLLVHKQKPLDAIVFTAMAKENNNGVLYPYVQGQLSTTLPYFVDCVFFLKAQSDEDGTMKRHLLTKPRLGYDVGDRTDYFESVIEDPRIDTMLEEFCEYMTGGS